VSVLTSVHTAGPPLEVGRFGRALIPKRCRIRGHWGLSQWPFEKIGLPQVVSRAPSNRGLKEHRRGRNRGFVAKLLGTNQRRWRKVDSVARSGTPAHKSTRRQQR